MHPALRIESLWTCYAAGIRGCSARAWVLRGLSLTIHAGEWVAIVGQRGAGKTTLAECILGLRVPMAGTVHVAGEVEIVDMQNAGMSAVLTVSRPAPVLPTSRAPAVPPSRISELPTPVLILARRADSLDNWADRLLLLRDGRLYGLAMQSSRRVAERSLLLLRR